MRVVQVNTSDVGGGAERVVRDLHDAYLAHGWDAELWVGHLRRGGRGVRGLGGEATPGPEPTPTLRWQAARAIRHPGWVPARLVGREYFGYPATERLVAAASNLDMIQLHNMHGDYFDLRRLPELSRRTAVNITMHDAWLTTGHCAHSLGCSRWEIGCGSCPDLSIYPSARRDATDANFAAKREIFTKSSLFVTTPSQWLLGRLARSMLAPAIVDAQVIPNGVDTRVFTPGDRADARLRLGLAPDELVLLTVGNLLGTNPFKDFRTLRAAVEAVAANSPAVSLLAVGAPAGEETIRSVRHRGTGVIDDDAALALHYRAADVYLHAARADTFPSAVLEAMASGVPVVATNVGGIPEQVLDRVTGYLVQPADVTGMAQATRRLVEDPVMREAMGRAAISRVASAFALTHQNARHIDWMTKIATVRRTSRAQPADRRTQLRQP